MGGAFTEPQTLQFFYDLGIPVANGYGLTEAGTAITVNDLRPFRADTVGKPLPGMEVRIVEPDKDGIGEVFVRSKTVMSGYLNEPELTAEAIVDGWLKTGDLGRFDVAGHLQLFGRKKNMIVTEEGKNIYPEDIEAIFESLPVKEFCVFAANYIWPQRSMTGEQLVLVIRIWSLAKLSPKTCVRVSRSSTAACSTTSAFMESSFTKRIFRAPLRLRLKGTFWRSGWPSSIVPPRFSLCDVVEFLLALLCGWVEVASKPRPLREGGYSCCLARRRA